MLNNIQEDQAVILVKAAPQISQKHGETVCCAGISIQEKKWVRLYPITFRTLEDSQKFSRWEIIRYKWSKSKNDLRPESRKVNHQSIEVISTLKEKERLKLLSSFIVSSINKEKEVGQSLALLKPHNPNFFYESKSSEDIQKEVIKFQELIKAQAQTDFFRVNKITPYQPCPYNFKYSYETDDGKREGTCQDWETEATFFNWSKEYGEQHALEKMQEVFGLEYPKKGMLFAMGTHSQYPDTWLINGIIRLNNLEQLNLFS